MKKIVPASDPLKNYQKNYTNLSKENIKEDM
jgi:hypothetical protein